MKKWLEFKATKPVPTNFSKILGKGDRDPALVLGDLQTQEGDLIDSKFIYVNRIPTRLSEKKILTTTIKESQWTINKKCNFQLGWIGYLEECTFYVVQLTKWNIVLGALALSAANAQISASKQPVTIQPPNMEQFPLTI